MRKKKKEGHPLPETEEMKYWKKEYEKMPEEEERKKLEMLGLSKEEIADVLSLKKKK